MSASSSPMRDRWRTLMELVRALWNGPHWWLVPVALLLMPLAFVFILLQAMPLVAPFVYFIF